ncbi:MAG: Asp-tRNA(Asn)/Glu-tRNA(Gln) amidotransferase subunit GatC [Bacteroidota bacterium]|jgi:aspartyl-tRNA(Asn)/glutamyl-tRNA(Gln) amidotransferase subunit C
MSISIDEVKYIANLSRLSFDEKELQDFTNQFNDILLFFEKLNELNTDNIEPLSHPISNTNVFREDEIAQSIECKEAVKNTLYSNDEFFIVPKVINQ